MDGEHPHSIDRQRQMIGVALFEAALARHGFRVAQPRSDINIDLIVYAADPGPFWYALPMQLRIAVGAAFDPGEGFMGRASLRDVVVAYIWVSEDKPRFFLLSYDEAVRAWEPWFDAEKLADFEDRWDWLRSRLTGGST